MAYPYPNSQKHDIPHLSVFENGLHKERIEADDGKLIKIFIADEALKVTTLTAVACFL